MEVLAMEVQVFVLLRDFLGALGFRSSDMQVGAATQVEFRVVPLRVKIQGLILIGCA
jgi:hypothetical protein